uniref:Leukocyte elastase inhibitor-like n=1 Tax=Hirondellea gigas TaxID=1518452 RepID=A0A2P2HX62_9CRUS
MTQYTAGVVVKQVKPKPRPRYHYCILGIVLFLLLLLPVSYFADNIAALLTSSSNTNTTSSEDRKMATPSDLSMLSTSLNTFTWDLYKSLTRGADDPSGNLLFSPLSIATTLAMTLSGTNSNTKQQLSEVLHLQEHPAVAAAFSSIISKYKSSDDGADCILRTANLMYVSNMLEMRQQFAEVITGQYKAAAKTVDFGGKTEEIRLEINSAVENETNSKIKNLIPLGVLNGLTRLVLVNAVYFKGLWMKSFDKLDTVQRPFHTSETESVMVPMMHKSADFVTQYHKDLEATVLNMEYKGSNLSMVIVLPDARTGLAALEEKMSGFDMKTLLPRNMKTKVEVFLPRFKLEYSNDLVKTLSGLGAEDLFLPGKSDLSGIGGPPGDLFVSNVLHKTFMEVNEEGTEAAAATAMIAMTRAMFRPPPPFVADHPFIFILQDNHFNITLFAGRYTTPDVSADKEEL